MSRPTRSAAEAAAEAGATGQGLAEAAGTGPTARRDQQVCAAGAGAWPGEEGELVRRVQAAREPATGARG